MKIYLFNPETGIYAGEDYADEAPLKRRTYVIPPDATTMEPPPVGQGEVPVFDRREHRWEVRHVSALRSCLLSDELNEKISSEEFL